MDSKRTDRRAFLKRGAALAGGLAAAKPAMAQLEGPEAFMQGTEELVG